jgi:GH24 family phage-related lysozyme (muramidase)
MRRLLPLILGLALLWTPSQADAVTMRTTKFVAGFEGFVSCPYADPAGHATIGYGHLLHYGRPTRADRRKWGCLTRNQALKLLKKDLRATEDEVLDRVVAARDIHVLYTAVTSFAFTVGPG